MWESIPDIYKSIVLILAETLFRFDMVKTDYMIMYLLI